MVIRYVIESMEDPRLWPYRTLKRTVELRQQGLVVVQGLKTVERLLRSSYRVVSLLMTEEWLEKFRPLYEDRPETIEAFVGPKAMIELIIGHKMYHGAMAVGRVPEELSWDEFMGGASAPRLLMAVEGFSNADNLGNVVRTCGAFGVQGLVVGETCCSPFLRRAVRSSMGVIFRLPVLEVSSLAETLKGLRREGVKCVAAHPHELGKSLAGVDFSGDCCVVLGSEGDGLSKEVLESCDEAVAIPMVDGVDSLNVAMAGAIFLYEVRRQRGLG